MEILAIALSGLLTIASSGGIIIDSVGANRLRSALLGIEKQAVRIDNSPSYQMTRGKVQKVRIAARGIKIEPNLRIEALELETDPLDLNLSQLDIDSIGKFRESLDRPFTGAVRLVLTEANLNQALQSPEILEQIQKTLNRFIVNRAGSTNIAYELQDLRLELLPANRLSVTFKLARPNTSFESDSDSGSRELVLALELGIAVNNGKEIRLVDPEGTINGQPMSSRLLSGFAEGISDRLNLDSLKTDGILARILQLEINEDRLNLASFLRVETKVN